MATNTYAKRNNQLHRYKIIEILTDYDDYEYRGRVREAEAGHAGISGNAASMLLNGTVYMRV